MQNSDVKEFSLPNNERLKERIYYEFMKPVEKDSKPDTRLLKVYYLLDAYGIHNEFYLPEIELMKHLKNVPKEDEKSISFIVRTLEGGKLLTPAELTTLQDLIYKNCIDHYSHILMLKETFNSVEELLSQGHKELYKIDDMRKLLNQYPVNLLDPATDDYDNLPYEIFHKKTENIESKLKIIIINSQFADST